MPEEKHKLIAVRLPQSLYDDLMQSARKNERTLSWMVRQSILYYLGHRKLKVNVPVYKIRK